MKKKGLIIATIVMVLVLAVSLTTATYAWFSTSAQSTITAIGITAASGGKVAIGLSAENELGTATDATEYVSGEVTAVFGTSSNNAAWVGTPNLGFDIDTKLALNSIAKAVGTSATAAPAENAKFTGSFDAANATTLSANFLKASGDKTTAAFIDTSVEEAIENEDYLHFVLGMQALDSHVDTFTLEMRFTTTPTAAGLMGVSQALHCLYRTTSGTWTNIDLGGSGTYLTPATSHKLSWTNGVADGTASSSTTTPIANGESIVKVKFGTDGGPYLEGIKEIEILIFYSGVDTDCKTTALGSSCTLSFAVTNTDTAVATQEP